jgi:hypothetical protein
VMTWQRERTEMSRLAATDVGCVPATGRCRDRITESETAPSHARRPREGIDADRRLL